MTFLNTWHIKRIQFILPILLIHPVSLMYTFYYTHNLITIPMFSTATLPTFVFWGLGETTITPSKPIARDIAI